VAVVRAGSDTGVRNLFRDPDRATGSAVAAEKVPDTLLPRQLAWLKWGLIPSWAKDPAIGNSLINARAESVADKPSFRTAFRRRRCLVVADGFYEWQRTGAK
jgi:putative SOS response-associated peptidase YedK